ncbi:MAG TPA: hypothetical protein VJP04_05140 [Terriglobales bacterium]|nr:hypothetical protein [Terriglobales bacterium]
MKILAELLFTLLLAGVLWGAPPQTHPTPQRAANNPCEQEWQAMAQRHREEADALLKESSGLRSLLTMLRNDAGIARDSTVRDALQVDADMWEMMLGRLQREAGTLQTLAQQEEGKRQLLCGSR